MYFKLLLASAAVLAVVAVMLMNLPKSPGFAVPLNAGFTPHAPASRPGTPPIDAEPHAKVETATFAMG